MKLKGLARAVGSVLLANALTFGAFGCASQGPPHEIFQYLENNLFCVQRYETRGDEEQNIEEKISFYELALNTLVYQGVYDEKQIDRLCSKLNESAEKLCSDYGPIQEPGDYEFVQEWLDCYKGLSSSIKENFSGYHSYFRLIYNGEDLEPIFHSGVRIAISLPLSLSKEEFEAIPGPLKGSNYYSSDEFGNVRTIKSMYTTLPCIADVSTIIN